MKCIEMQLSSDPATAHQGLKITQVAQVSASMFEIFKPRASSSELRAPSSELRSLFSKSSSRDLVLSSWVITFHQMRKGTRTVRLQGHIVPCIGLAMVCATAVATMRSAITMTAIVRFSAFSDFNGP